MTSTIENKLRNARSIAVFRALVLGDLLCAVPALRALREGCPGTKITFIGLAWSQEFAERFSHLIDDFLAFPGYPGLPETVPDIRQIPAFFQEAQHRNFDISIQMHGSGPDVNAITALLGAKRSAGFYLNGQWCPDPGLFMPFPQEGHEINKLLQLMEFLGLPTGTTGLEFPLKPKDFEDFHAIEETRGLNEEYVCIHPGARLMSRQWLPERFAGVADFLSALGLKVVLTGSPQEKGLVESVVSHMRAPFLNLAGKTSLGALGVLLNGARLVVCNDTGISHMASALKVPSVVVVSGSDFKRWAPLDQELHQLVYAPIDCRPCSHDICPIGQSCSHKISVLDVVTAAEKLLSGPADSPRRSERSVVCAG